MTDLRKAAEMALEALEELRFANAPFLDEAMEALRTALAQPKQEPVAWLHELADGHRHCVTKDESGYVDNFTDTYKTIPLYTAPQKREWVALTEEDKQILWKYGCDNFSIQATETVLKEKNRCLS